MTNSVSDTLNLTSHQSQVLDDLGIDAWYVKSLSLQSSPESLAEQAQIADIVASFTESMTVSANHETANVGQSVADTKAAHNVGLADSADNTANVAKTVNANNSNDPNNVGVTATASPVTMTEETQSETPLSLSIPLHRLPPIVLDDKLDITPPAERLIHWQTDSELSPVAADKTAIAEATRQLPQQSDYQSPLLSTQTWVGQGSDVAQDFFILPPMSFSSSEREASLLSDDERQLLSEMLTATGRSIDHVYLTPLLKQSLIKPADPDEKVLAPHLAILAAEIIRIAPKRLWLLGRVPAQVLLQTYAPLSQLLSDAYSIAMNNTQNNIPNNTHVEQPLPVTLMQSLNYYLAIPAEKAALWQQLKPLAIRD